MLCENCGKEIEESDLTDNSEKNGERNWFITLILSWFAGVLGLHRFYTGYVGIGIAQALTCGGLGIWSFIDFILICTGEYKTKEGKHLFGYNKTLGVASIFIFVMIASSKFIINVVTELVLQYLK